MFIDADAHADECWETWSYFPKAMEDLRPAEMHFVDEQTPGHLDSARRSEGLRARALYIEGQIFNRRTRSDEQTHTTEDIRELRDIPGRLKHMDELGIDVQILYPSVLLHEVTQRPELEIAICESYNRWMGDRCSESNGRMRWNAVLPMLSMDAALKEMRRVKEAGAVGIMRQGFGAGQRRAGSDYFQPAYALAEELDLPICFHSGKPYYPYLDTFTKTRQQIHFDFYVHDAFLSLLRSGTCAAFPKLRFGIIEAASSWLPYALYTHQFADMHRAGSNTAAVVAVEEDSARIRDEYAGLLAESRLFVTCEAAENLPAIIAQVGDDNLMVGTDYGHADRSAILHGHRAVAERTDLSPESVEKLTRLNAARFYGVG